MLSLTRTIRSDTICLARITTDERRGPMMTMLYKMLVRPALFLCDPERIHDLTLSALDWAGKRRLLLTLMFKLFVVRDSALTIRVSGLLFPNPIVLPAGFTKTGAGNCSL